MVARVVVLVGRPVGLCNLSSLVGLHVALGLRVKALRVLRLRSLFKVFAFLRSRLLAVRIGAAARVRVAAWVRVFCV